MVDEPTTDADGEAQEVADASQAEAAPAAEGAAPAAEGAALAAEGAAPAAEGAAPAAEGAAPAAEGAAPAAEGAAAARWYAVRVQSNKEDSVRRNMARRIELRGLQRKITQLVVPTEKVAEIKNGKKRTRQVKTYPGYVLVEMVMDDESWAFVRETPGVGDFVGGNAGAHQKPFPLLPEEVNKIFGVETPDAEAPKIKIDFGQGDRVKIREGPFENFDGVVEQINEQKGTVRVVVTIFGRATPVELQYWQVETI